MDLNGKQVKYLRMVARLLPFRMTEMNLMMVFICVQESASKNMLCWTAVTVVNWKLVGMDGDAEGSDLWKVEDAGKKLGAGSPGRF